MCDRWLVVGGGLVWDWGIRYDFVGGILTLRAITLITPAKQWVRGRIRHTKMGNLSREHEWMVRLLLRGCARARVRMYVMTWALRLYDCGRVASSVWCGVKYCAYAGR